MNKKIIVAMVTVTLLIGGYIYVSPYIMLNNLKSAINANDSAKVASYVDFPSVRQNLKAQMNTYLTKQMDPSKHEGMEGLGQMFALVMVDKITDLVVTPEGLTLMMQGKTVNLNLDSQIKNTNNPIQVQPNQTATENYSTQYLSINEFEITIATQEKYKQVKVILERDGLSWKIIKVSIPMDKNQNL
ncbi:DUF2939 domain-containing protein [Acinetobacter boissieri]|uniref:DUF2939 domain-containing protein n=1 Tax=Acinetobacter boissieri TaxID=1219383 RepID=A0A1G6IVJ7_9GAMM|nr:DUF2939 domain-containing protein [Acinetobacter boissieri]SDC10440.1 Protein of unknown function [Acinetobacter boissieri]